MLTFFSKRILLYVTIITTLIAIALTSANSAVNRTHPRIWLTKEKLDALKATAAIPSKEWVRLKEYVDNSRFYYERYTIRALGLVYLVTGDKNYGRQAIGIVMEEAVNKGLIEKFDDAAPSMGYVALAYDWCYDLLTYGQKQAIIAWLNDEYDYLKKEYLTAWHNYAVSNTCGIGLAGYATFGDNPRAMEMINHARFDRFEKLILPGLSLSGEGGGWAEGSYGIGTILTLIQYVEAVRTATGEDIYSQTSFFKDRLAFVLFNEYPSIEKYYNQPYRPFYVQGDGSREYKGSHDYLRATKLMLIARYPNTDIAKYAQDSVSTLPLDYTPHTWACVDDFLWYNPKQPSLPLLSARAPLSHFAEGTGTVFMRSDWSNDATWISFQCGDHFEYHQHLDQNSFTIYKFADLAIDSGIYDWSNSGHSNNYYARTVAHNSALVFDPNEKISWDRMRGGYDGVNDGGQRAWRLSLADKDRASWSAENVETWQKFQHLYDTGNILQYEDVDNYVYVVGDATNAYRPDKVKNFKRHLLFLRPSHLIVFDQITSTNPTYPKKWLLHFINEPEVNGFEQFISNGESVFDGDMTVATNGEGKLFVQTIFPEKHRIIKIGGRNIKDYWVNGENHPPHNAQKFSYGSWRIEVEPVEPKQEDIFLHVLYVTDVSKSSAPATMKIISQEGSMVGVNVEKTAVLFNRQPIDRVEYILTGRGIVNNILCNLEPHTTFLMSVDDSQPRSVTVSAGGTLYFRTNLTGRNSIKLSISHTANNGNPSRLTRPGKPQHDDD